MLGGVAGGLGKYFDVDPLIFRIGFGISVFFGGLGAVAYIALLLLVPSEEDDGSVGEAPIQRSRTLAIAAAVGVFIFLASWGIFDGDPFWFDGGPWFFGGPLFLIAILVALFFLLRRDEDQGRRARPGSWPRSQSRSARRSASARSPCAPRGPARPAAARRSPV